ncbi:pentapeptide repeat-containing protein [Aquabacterium sp. CECT 9606]|uniref:pentapeptide repeat-containing protein n=1 Tax=Aquabacterium sp. CECT 9606 TaxID=2845822 RepID=UPI001E567D23|nr:pentapeptide repeat-containing protein [Aquabacterium sp. CECT 9606]CAH0351040.1 hypothetical protein AQB9606_01894 [Aquabacterium sp. CECT 9606]
MAAGSSRMRKLNKPEFEALVAGQKTGPQDSPENDLRDIEISDTPVQNLDGVTIAMSRLSRLSFGLGSSLQGSTWIGNEILDCTFSDTAMNKSEMLDCVIEACRLNRTSLFRADWSGSVFKRCTLEGLDLSTTCLINTLFEDCTFTQVQLMPGEILNGRQTVSFDPIGKRQNTAA